MRVRPGGGRKKSVNVSTFRILVLAIALCGGLLALRPVSAAVIAEDGFAYTAGDLGGQNGGSGDWKDKWSADSELDVTLGSWGYTDSLGNALQVSGAHVELDSDPGGFKKAERTLNNKLGTGTSTVWFSIIVDGTGTSEVHNVSLGDGLFFGQGIKNTGSTTWGLGAPSWSSASTSRAATRTPGSGLTRICTRRLRPPPPTRAGWRSPSRQISFVRSWRTSATRASTRSASAIPSPTWRHTLPLPFPSLAP